MSTNPGQLFYNNSSYNRNKSHLYFSYPNMENPHRGAGTRMKYLVTQCCGLTPTPLHGQDQHKGHTRNVNNVNTYHAFVILNISISAAYLLQDWLVSEGWISKKALLLKMTRGIFHKYNLNRFFTKA